MPEMDITDRIIRAAIFGVLAAVVIGTFQNLYTAIKNRGKKLKGEGGQDPPRFMRQRQLPCLRPLLVSFDIGWPRTVPPSRCL